ncbi:hypothetical protein KQX54_007854 [Cotesia glomerata]|uniref:Uncharacterized protein n=1 Tax=Cotesia glomerata TaxID=32391 RepID=A0AAV7HZ74_COTGL|nr:hypothetical protein KQX54_007854 [Cotesia glomerata]
MSSGIHRASEFEHDRSVQGVAASQQSRLEGLMYVCAVTGGGLQGGSSGSASASAGGWLRVLLYASSGIGHHPLLHTYICHVLPCRSFTSCPQDQPG